MNFGREGCKYFADQGAFVVGMDKDAFKLHETLEYASSEHAEMTECDVTKKFSSKDTLITRVLLSLHQYLVRICQHFQFRRPQ